MLALCLLDEMLNERQIFRFDFVIERRLSVLSDDAVSDILQCLPVGTQ